ncbi:MAG: D-aminoacyl-tRNA deacylase [Caldilineaceae bacterium]
MRAVVQRVSEAGVTVDGDVVGQIGRGFLVLLGIAHADTEKEADWLARKIAGLRLFEDGEGKMNLSLADVDGAGVGCEPVHALRRRPQRTSPQLHRSRPPRTCPAALRLLLPTTGRRRRPVERGIFQAEMKVSLINDGPVTLWLETEKNGA